MPTRPCSPAILGGLWPTTSADAWSDVADAMRRKAETDADSSAAIRKSADGLYPDNSGHLIDGMHSMYMRDALAVMDQSDLYHSMSRVVEEVAQLIYHARTQLDEIDRAANEQIERLKAAAHGGGIGAALRLSAVVSEIAAVIAKARSAAGALSASIAAEISIQLARLGTVHKIQTPSASDGSSLDDLKGLNFAGGSPRNGMPTGWVPPPLSPQGDEPPKTDGTQPNIEPGTKDPISGPLKPDQPKADPTGTKNEPQLPRTRDVQPGIEGFDEPNQPLPIAPVNPRPTTSTSGPSIPMTSSPSSGISFPQTGLPSTGMPSGTSSAPPLSPGLTSPAAGLTPPHTPVPPATPNDFSRGLSAGLGASGGGGAPLLPPPVSSPTPPQMPSTAGAPSGPPPVSPGAGSSTTAVPAAAPAGPVGPVMPPAAPPGPLPPFTSDLPRSAPVTPASGPPVPAAPAPPPPAASPPVAPLPPGVVASGVGASAAGAGAGLRSSTPDPLLESASRLGV